MIIRILQAAAVLLFLVTSSNLSLAHKQKLLFEMANRPLPSVELQDHNGRQVSLQSLAENKNLIITFQFAACQTLCPASHLVMQDVQAQLEKPGSKKNILLLSITLDPENDTAEVLSLKAKEFGSNESWLWLTGTPDAMDQVYDALDLPKGAKESHDVFFLLAYAKNGLYRRVAGIPTPQQLLDAVSQ